ncbi:GABA permease [Pseudomonas sp. NPDC089569]|uniref:GABA permease n=1 Tax=Pseudomonas sp. NPDC089569 TaxID=3390722 RepID=UPI003D05FCC2
MSSSSNLAPGLKQRHVTMLSIAGAIGAGLFIGSGHAIAAAGPAAILAYIFSGTLVVLVMRMLGEMAVASPDTGSFSTYAERALGRSAGFTIGWLYWWFWVLVIPIEAIAAAAILHAWFPAIQTWEFAIAVTGLLTLTNLFSVARYGEFEFWFAMLKVIAVLGFIALGALALAGALPNTTVSGVVQLSHAFGGFMPNGMTAVVGAMLTTVFSFMGTEIVTIAAAESRDPSRQITRATNSVVWRMGIFYIVSVFLIISIVPWNDPMLMEVGSYQRALELMNIPHAKLIVDIVVLIAVASCLNSAIYTASRMVYSLSKRGDGPQVLQKTSSSGVPYIAVLASTAVGFLTTALNYFAPDDVFAFLLATSGAVALLVYLVIAVSQLKLRKKMIASGQPIVFKMWFYPWLSYLVIVCILGILTVMLILPQHRMEVVATGALALSIVCMGGIFNSRKKNVPGIETVQTEHA